VNGKSAGVPPGLKENKQMRYINALALLLVIVGGINWLLVGIADFDLVATLTGDQFGQTNLISSVIYVLVGVAAIWLLPSLVQWVAQAHESQTPVRSGLARPAAAEGRRSGPGSTNIPLPILRTSRGRSCFASSSRRWRCCS